MLIALAPRLFDVAGYVLLTVQNEDLGETRRRLSRTATLDGGAAVNDVGFSDADRVMNIGWEPTPAEEESITRLVRLHERISVSCRAGCFESVIESYSVRDGRARLVLLPLSRMSE